jgi:hypothetical protein
MEIHGKNIRLLETKQKKKNHRTEMEREIISMMGRGKERKEKKEVPECCVNPFTGHEKQTTNLSNSCVLFF